jgi:hypothetical protein
MKRRTLLNLAVTATSLSPFYRVQLTAAAREFPPQSPASLRQIARVVLPSTLGTRGSDDQVENLAKWIREYREGAEMDHGYGRPRVRYLPPSPVDTYVTQIQEIDAAAQQKGQTFHRLDRETQRAILDDAFKKAEVTAMPSRPAGRHVVADLMALFTGLSR